MKLTPRHTLRCTTAMLCFAASTAHAWDPMANTDTITATPHVYRTSVLPAHIVPQRYYDAPVVAAAPAQVVPAAAPQPVVPYVAPAPTPVDAAAMVPQQEYAQPRYQPQYQYSDPVDTAPPTPIAAANDPATSWQAQPVPYDQPYQPPAPIAVANTQPLPPSAPAPADYDANRFLVGFEAFYDNYKEPETFPDLDSNAYYGAVDLGYDHYFSPTVYAGFEGRASYGSNDYKSDSGSIHGVPQWEFDARFIGGTDRNLGEGRRIKTYFGLGGRYFSDESKGEVTNLGSLGYDRRILQIYAPIGVTYEYPYRGITFAPNLEIDPILYGNVQSRLQNSGLPGYGIINNRQTAFSGVGLRAEFMMKQTYENDLGWEFGPFIRYWGVADSETDSDGSGDWLEPMNTRVQVGTKLKLLF